MNLFSTIYTTTLKKAICVPIACKNIRLFDLLRIPSPDELGAYFITIAFEKIISRGTTCPDAVKGAYFGALIMSDRYKDKKQKRMDFKQKGYLVSSSGKTTIDCLILAGEKLNHSILYFLVDNLLTKRDA